MTTQPSGGQLTVRAGDAERDACHTALVDHYVHGRLDDEELDRRQKAALQATRMAELDLLLADLPGAANASLTHPSRNPFRAAEAASGLARIVVPVGTVLGGAWISQWAWQLSDEGPFLGALAGGALGYAVHAVMSRFRRGRTTPRPDPRV